LVRIDGRECGPYTIGELQRLFVQEKIEPETPFATPGSDNWQPLEAIYQRMLDYEEAPIVGVNSQSASAKPSENLKPADLMRFWGVFAVLIALTGGFLLFVWHPSPRPPSPGPPKQPVTGAFGFTLGRQAVAHSALSTNSDGTIDFGFHPGEPFSDGWVSLTPDGVIYEIRVSTFSSDNIHEFKKATLIGLEEKYGLLHDSRQEKERLSHAVRIAGYGIRSEDRKYFEFGTNQRRVIFSPLGDSFFLTYEDHDLGEKVRADLKAKREAAAKRSARTL
jgi:hypothetical protein